MEGEESHSGKVGGGRYGSSDGIGDVVVLQVQENSKSHTGESLDGTGAFGREKLTTNLEKARRPVEPPGQLTGRPEAIYVQSDD